jgi:hypothetical protein
MIKPNKNFHNQYEARIKPSDRSKALSLFNKMSESKPGLMQEAEVNIREDIDGSIFIFINNMSAFGETTTNVIKKFLNTMKYPPKNVNNF